MTTVRRFDRFVLKPIHFAFILAAVLFLIQRQWLWLVGAICGSFYLGIIGSKLHPLQSFSDLASGPTTSPDATTEEAVLSALDHRILIGHACTRVGILIGVSIGIIAWAAMDWRWYFALIVGCITVVMSGALLKVIFRAV